MRTHIKIVKSCLWRRSATSLQAQQVRQLNASTQLSCKSTDQVLHALLLGVRHW